MEPEHKHYRSFLMRIWRSGESRDAGWRVSLVDPLSGEQIGFTDMEALTSYVYKLTDWNSAQADAAQEGEI